MRFAVCLLPFLPSALSAETFVVPSRATEAVIYPDGGIVTHRISVDVPAGRHQLQLPDLPPGLSLENMIVTSEDVQIGALRFRETSAPPRPTPEPPEVIAARDKVTEIEDRMQSVVDAAQAILLEAEAAEARITFLAALGKNEGLPKDANQLAALADLIAAQTLEAKKTALDARIEARRTRLDLDDLQDELDAAQAELDALVPEPKVRPALSVEVTAQDATSQAVLNVSFVTGELGWQPTNDFHLNSETDEVVVHRSALVEQFTGENWRDVQLRLSTQQIDVRSDPSVLRPWLRRIEDPEQPRLEPRAMLRSQAEFATTAIVEAPVIVEESAVSSFSQGLAVVYAFSNPVDIASGTDSVNLPFDTQTFGASILARAVPLQDDTAFVMASFVNDGEAPILAGGLSRKFYDGGLVGFFYPDVIAVGEEVEIGFGEILGLQAKRTVLERAEGDRGFIARSNEAAEDVRIGVTNLTDRAWTLQLRDRVPFSEQEDLRVDWNARPAPDVEDLDNKRGVLQWDLEVDAGAEREVFVSYRLEWPDGMVLR